MRSTRRLRVAKGMLCMRLLLLSAWCPLPADNGVRLRYSNLLRGLARRHQVDLLTFAPEPLDSDTLRELRTICSEVELLPETPFAGRPVSAVAGFFSPIPRLLVANYSPALAAAVRARAGRPYDAVIAAELHMLPYALMLPVPRLLDGLEIGVIRDQYRAQKHPVHRARAYLTWWKLSRYLGRILPEFAAVTSVSPVETKLLRAITPTRVPIHQVPNGVDLASYAGYDSSPEPDLLIYPGSLSFGPNFDAVHYFAADILPRIRAVRPAARLLVTGKATPEQIAALPKAEGLEFAGHLPDVRPAIARAWAEVVPLRQGSGTRLKILEAQALGTPVISTSKGAEGLELVAERDLLIADTPDTFAAQTLRLLASPELRGRLSAQGRAAVARYDWSYSVEALEEALELATAKAGGVPLLSVLRGEAVKN